jgi:hypothetical protein
MAPPVRCCWEPKNVVRGACGFSGGRKSEHSYILQTCLASHRLKTAASYLLILHNLEQLDEHNGEIVRLLREAIKANDWQLCQELLRFIHSIDETGVALRNALLETGAISAHMENPITNGQVL